jgi:hypothetical protein
LNDKKVTARTRFVVDARADLTLRSKFKVKGQQHWYAVHRLEVVYLHAKYEKAYLERQKSYSPDTICTICYGRTDQFDLEVKGHQQWYMTHRLEVVYLHAKYEKPVLNDKKVTALTQFVTDAQTVGRTE